MGLPEEAAEAVRALMEPGTNGWVVVLYRPEYRQDDHEVLDALAWHRDWFSMISLGQPPDQTEVVELL